VYLNDLQDDTGGRTVFADRHHHRHNTKVTSSIEPKGGLIAIMCHDLIHAGEPLKFGSKYIIRSDIIFECIFECIERPVGYDKGLWIKDP
jgi:hypothetical protein